MANDCSLFQILHLNVRPLKKVIYITEYNSKYNFNNNYKNPINACKKNTSMFGFVQNKNDYRQVHSVDENNIESISYLLKNRCLD